LGTPANACRNEASDVTQPGCRGHVDGHAVPSPVAKFDHVRGDKRLSVVACHTDELIFSLVGTGDCCIPTIEER
jgi:hypothetical protein